MLFDYLIIKVQYKMFCIKNAIILPCYYLGSKIAYYRKHDY